MKTKMAILLVVLILLTSSLVISVNGQAGTFIIVGSDAKVDLFTSSSPNLLNLVNSVVDRFIVEFANEKRIYNIQPVPSDLLAQVNNVQDRYMIQYANANRFYPLAYPKDMLNDLTPPQLVLLTTQPSGSATIRMTFDVSEYSTIQLEYGTQSGVYSYSISIDDYSKQHVIFLSGLEPDKIYYFQYTLIDRSENSFVSNEGIFSLHNVYLPYMKR